LPHQVSMKEEDGFHLDVEDYLSGLLQLASELVLITFLILNNF
jgi:hypothetical protein